ncbi:MAG TPA: hypothetical protein PLJ21_09510 [Pseudobdellovibrionaceae bacterium]|nr:hypothetical protein [Pseudobdellovibrionaceae bacterium]
MRIQRIFSVAFLFICLVTFGSLSQANIEEEKEIKQLTELAKKLSNDQVSLNQRHAREQSQYIAAKNQVRINIKDPIKRQQELNSIERTYTPIFAEISQKHSNLIDRLNAIDFQIQSIRDEQNRRANFPSKETQEKNAKETQERNSEFENYKKTEIAAASTGRAIPLRSLQRVVKAEIKSLFQPLPLFAHMQYSPLNTNLAQILSLSLGPAIKNELSSERPGLSNISMMASILSDKVTDSSDPSLAQLTSRNLSDLVLNNSNLSLSLLPNFSGINFSVLDPRIIGDLLLKLAQNKSITLTEMALLDFVSSRVSDYHINSFVRICINAAQIDRIFTNSLDLILSELSIDEVKLLMYANKTWFRQYQDQQKENIVLATKIYHFTAPQIFKRVMHSYLEMDIRGLEQFVTQAILIQELGLQKPIKISSPEVLFARGQKISDLLAGKASKATDARKGSLSASTLLENISNFSRNTAGEGSSVQAKYVSELLKLGQEPKMTIRCAAIIKLAH